MRAFDGLVIFENSSISALVGDIDDILVSFDVISTHIVIVEDTTRREPMLLA